MIVASRAKSGRSQSSTLIGSPNRLRSPTGFHERDCVPSIGFHASVSTLYSSRIAAQPLHHSRPPERTHSWIAPDAAADTDSFTTYRHLYPRAANRPSATSSSDTKSTGSPACSKASGRSAPLISREYGRSPLRAELGYWHPPVEPRERVQCPFDAHERAGWLPVLNVVRLGVPQESEG